MNTNENVARTKILVAIDDSAPAQWALQAAASFATRLNAETLLVTVIPKPESVGAAVVFAGTALDYHGRLEEEALLRLRDARNGLPPTVPCNAVVREGNATPSAFSLTLNLHRAGMLRRRSSHGCVCCGIDAAFAAGGGGA